MAEIVEIQIGVRALVEHVLRHGDLEPVAFRSNRSLESIRAHQKVQKERPAHYEAEVSVSYCHDADEHRLHIGGRIDGVYRVADQVIIDEIKTTTIDKEVFLSERFDGFANRRHWAQAQVYAYLYARQHNLAAVTVQLTYVHLDNGQKREFSRDHTRAHLKKHFLTLIQDYLRWSQRLAAWIQTRDQSIAALTFPHSVFRPGQRRMAVAVYRAIQDQTQLLVQAPTGIGKTMAALFPAIKATAPQAPSKLFYLTARTTGRTVAEAALLRLRARGLRFKTLTLTAKDKICFHPDGDCTPEDCLFAKGHYDRLNQALAVIFDRDAFTRPCIEKVALAHRVCPFEFSLSLAAYCDGIIGDYNYAFDPRVHLRYLFEESGISRTLLIDEAHNLADRARDMFSAALRKQDVLDLRRQLKTAQPAIARQLMKINRHLLDLKKACDAKWTSQNQAPWDLIALLRVFGFMAEKYLARNQAADFRETLIEFYFQVLAFLRIAELYDDSYVTYLEPQGKDLIVKLLCLDPAANLRQALARGSAAIFFSATLTPISFFRENFGCHPDARGLRLASPFPPAHLQVHIDRQTSILYRDRERTCHRVVEAIHCMVRCQKGNYLFFFPSYAYMNRIHGAFQQRCPDVNTLLQAEAMSESEREGFLDRFEVQPSHSLVAWAVMGGIFGEGIDLAGSRLTAVGIVGVGLPALTPERELMRAYFDERNGQGFAFAYQFPGINRVLQAAGRLIRSETDRGAILLIDTRYGQYRYRRLLPEEWRPRYLWNYIQLTEDLDAFWNQTSQKTV
jgi:DNA excision repair protein ERCC-2